MERLDEHIVLYEAVHGKTDDIICNRIIKLMYTISQDKVFCSSVNRLLFSYAAKLITYDNVDVGFIFAVKESRLDEAAFIDMAILKNYRGKNIGYRVLEYFVNIFNNTYFIGEVSKNNIASNTIAGRVGKEIVPGYYILPASNYDKLIEENKLDYFIDKLSKKQETASQILRRINNR